MIVRLGLALALLSTFGACNDEATNLPPIATQDFATLDEDTPIALDVLANDSDPEGKPLRLVRATVADYKATVEGGLLHVATPENWNGSLDVTYTVSDGAEYASGHALITVTPVNDAPTATSAVLATGRNEAKLFHLQGTDADGDAVTFEIDQGPAHGTLTGTPPDLTYTPATGYVGLDLITFHARDAASSSSPAGVNITVLPGTAPVSYPQSLTIDEDTSKAITLAATDADNDPITYMVTQQPSHGTLTGTPPAVTYVPAADYHGFDRFRFVATDGVLTSAPEDIDIQITARNDAPVAQAQTVATLEDQLANITLVGTDVDGDSLTYTIITQPTRGSLVGGGPVLSYHPTTNVNGTDSFTFTVSDGTITSAPATVTINVAAVQDAPVATQQIVNTNEDTTRMIVLAGTDADGDALTYAIATNPTHGTLAGVPPMLMYTPNANYNGADSFTFTVNDGVATSTPVTVSLNVLAVDDPPTIAGASLSGNEGENISIPLPRTDIDGDALTYTVSTPPAKGTVSGTSILTFNSGDGNGTLTFALTVSDGHSMSAPATFTVAVTPVPDAPIAHDDIGIATPGQSLRVALLANDDEVDGDTMSLQSIGTPLHGTAVIDGDDIVYTTTPGNLATDKVTYTVVDSTGLTATATLYVGIGEFPTGMPTRYVDNVIDGGSFNQFLEQDISRDGRYVAFTTLAALTAGDTNGASDVYVFDRVTNTRERISVPTGGGLANAASERPAISADGRYIAFASAATNLVPNDTNGSVDVFVRDRVAGTTKRVSVSSSGAQVSGASRDPEISADGSVIVFASSAFELVPNDANGAADIFVRDMTAETTTRVSVRVDGGEADQPSLTPVASDDGNVVAFVSASTNLVPGDTNGKADVFVHVRSTHTTERVSVSSTGVEANAQNAGRPALSADGRFVAFLSTATNLVPSVTSSAAYIRDRQALTTVLGVTLASTVSLSGDGRYLTAQTGNSNVFVRDRFANQSVTFSPSNLYFPVISASGRYIALLSTGDIDNVTHPTGTKLFIVANPL